MLFANKSSRSEKKVTPRGASLRFAEPDYEFVGIPVSVLMFRSIWIRRVVRRGRRHLLSLEFSTGLMIFDRARSHT
jgi:hypothetical protein